jgi:hypothetical protein
MVLVQVPVICSATRRLCGLCVIGLDRLDDASSIISPFDRSEKSDATKGAGPLVGSLSISLDSRSLGIALPALAITLLPLLVTASITATA